MRSRLQQTANRRYVRRTTIPSDADISEIPERSRISRGPYQGIPYIPPAALQLVDRLKNPPPNHGPVDVAFIEKLIGPRRCTYRRILAMLVDQQLRGAEYVGVVDYAIAYIDTNLRCQPGFGFGPPR